MLGLGEEGGGGGVLTPLFLTLSRFSFLVVDFPTEGAAPLLRPKKFLEGR